ncbi:MAG: hypothetical protein MJ185_02245 [Treponema sp.]|nr:hypothetical protein [Treponema sp.]
MKKITALFICLFCISCLFAQEENLNPVTGFPEIEDKPFALFNEGVSAAQITRIITQDERSNFVWQDYYMGMFFEVQTANMQPYNSILRLTAYYPIYHTFNGMKQIQTQMFLYGLDLFYGVMFESDMWKYVGFKWAIGPHFAYNMTDEWHHMDAGIGALLGAELPLEKKWTIIADGLASLDYGNFGSNRKIMPYNVVWQYQLGIGFRYSKKGINTYSYIK